MTVKKQEPVCPKCGSPFFTYAGHSAPTGKTNAFGREEISFVAEYTEYIHWNPETSRYDCKKCGYSSTFKEMTLQKLRDAPLVEVSKKGVMQTEVCNF